MPRRSSRRRSHATNGSTATPSCLADDLAGQEIERAEGKPQEHDRIDDSPATPEVTTARNQPRRASGV